MLTFVKSSLLGSKHGERIIAPVAAAILAVLILATLFSMWWAGSSERSLLRTSQQAQLKALSETLTNTVPALITHDDLAPLRRLVVGVKNSFHLAECRISLPDGRIIADGVPSQIKVQTLPDHWSSGPLDADLPAAAASGAVAQFPLTIPNRGTVIVYLLAPVTLPAWARSDMQTGLSLIGMAGISFILVFYRHLRSRVAVLGMIRESLLLTGSEMNDPAFLRLDPSFGPEALSWNALIERQHGLRTELAVKQTSGLLGQQSSSSPELETACDALPDGLVILKSDGAPRYLNGAAANFLGKSRDALLVGPLFNHLHDEALKAAIAGTLSGADRHRRVLEVETKLGDAKTVLRVELHPLRCNGRDELLLAIHDVTQQRIADASRNSFVAHITHELRNPLSTIGLYLDTAATDGENDPVIRAKCLNVITTESRRLERIVSEMLSVSEIEAGSMRLRLDDLRLDSLFQGLREEYATPAQKKNITLTFDLPPKFPVLQADRERIALTLHNLMGNAMKYTPNGGAVKVALKVEATQIRFEVTDTGIGIEEKEQEQVFNSFYRSKDPRVDKIIGTGLGLTLAREIARLHGGDITLQSQLNKGSTFALTLPMTAPRS